MSQQPSVAVRRMNDIHVPPLQRSARRRKRDLRELALVNVVMSIFSRTRKSASSERQESEECRSELHRGGGQEDVLVSPRAARAPYINEEPYGMPTDKGV